MGTQFPLPQKGGMGTAQRPPILETCCCGQTAGSIKMPLGTIVGLGPGKTMLDANPAPPPSGTVPLPKFWPMSFVAKQLDG